MEQDKSNQNGSDLSQPEEKAEQSVRKTQKTAAANTESEEFKNYKEKLYDKIPISLKNLDRIIIILTALLVIIMTYFILRKYF